MSFTTERAIYVYRQQQAARFAEWVAAGCPERFVIKEKGKQMGKKAVDDLSDILGDTDTPATKGAAKMGKKEDKAAAAKAAVAASAAKHAKGGKAPAKAAPAKAAKAPAKKGGSKGGEGKFYFPVASKEREDVKKRVLALVNKKGSISTKEAASTLNVETFKVRLVSVELESEKLIKREKDGNAFTLKKK